MFQDGLGPVVQGDAGSVDLADGDGAEGCRAGKDPVGIGGVDVLSVDEDGDFFDFFSKLCPEKWTRILSEFPISWTLNLQCEQSKRQCYASPRKK